MVLEIPPADEGSITGSIDDGWQTALEDVGPAGVDKGKGGKYLILPPGYKDKVPDGYIALPSDTYQGYALLRSILKSGSDADVAKAVAYGKRVKVYPLSQAANPPPTTFVDAIDVVFDAPSPTTCASSSRSTASCSASRGSTRDKAMIDLLKSIGIEKGKPFKPDAKTQAILNDAAREAHAWLDARYEALFSPPYYRGQRTGRCRRRPSVIEGHADDFANPDTYPVDARGVALLLRLLQRQALGDGPVLPDDDQGQGRQPPRRRQHLSPRTCRPNAPVKQYWSATVYDRATHALIRDMPWASRSSQDAGPAKERRRFGGHLFRSEGASGQGSRTGFRRMREVPHVRRFIDEAATQTLESGRQWSVVRSQFSVRILNLSSASEHLSLASLFRRVSGSPCHFTNTSARSATTASSASRNSPIPM